jgi:signal transduction histidine kinase
MPVYFRYFVLFSFLFVAGAAHYLGLYLEKTATQAFILKPAEERSRFYAGRIRDSLLCRYPHIFSGSRLADDAEAAKFDKLADAVLGFFPQYKTSLYNKKGLIIAANNDDDIVMFDQDREAALAKALSEGRPAGSVGMSGAYERGNAVPKRGYYGHFVLPLSSDDCKTPVDKGGVAGAVEFFYRVDDIQSDIARFRLFVMAGVVAVFCLFYVALYLSSRQKERIIQKQHEEKMHLEKAKAVAETQSHEKSMFLANITHELRTPLNAIIGFSEILKDEVVEPKNKSKYKEYVHDIHSSGVHLLGLINDILDYSKAEASKLEVEMMDVDLKKIAMSCLRLIEPKATDAGLKLTSDFPEKNVIMKGDPKRIKQVMLNLLSNAVKFTPPGGEVSLAVKEEIVEEAISITISDTGIGIPKRLIQKALSPFGQVDSSMSRNNVGTGLGLPLTKKLTEIMGGTFIFQSEKDLGTSVTLRFPHSTVDVEKEAIEF